ncbi:LysR family transcriptional regulator [uncultured Neptuniibacter sp.]|uniref:LysR family transcriptional regulator n=1 Tax=uncultured Neptuniibacter sp. TaxID=502143 RepID=UPI00262282C8|nr:LysR family transcriptional regulator [uncultured Neptuniibacter sp.]
MNRWSEMQAFTESVREGSFSAAAKVLGISPSAVSKLISRLEKRLQTRLLNRTTRQISLTEAGQLFYQRCYEILHEVEEAEAEIESFGVNPQGTLRINCSSGFANHQLLPLLPAFQTRYPSLTVELQLTGRPIDLVAESVDLAIRLGELEESSLVASPLGSSQRIICAAPEYLRRYGYPDTPSELSQHNCLRLSSREGFNRWHFRKGEDIETVDVQGNFITDNVEALYEYAIKGGGIVRLSGFMLKSALDSGALVPLLLNYETDPQWVNAIYPHRRFLPAKVRLFIDFLKENLNTEDW